MGGRRLKFRLEIREGVKGYRFFYSFSDVVKEVEKSKLFGI